MISIVIPVREGGDPSVTLASLAGQMDPCDDECEIIISWDRGGRGANWARNRGAEKARGELILFSDDDISWQPGAVELLRAALEKNPGASYSYGSYEMAGRVQCDVPWSRDRLLRSNYISTMSMIRRAHFPGFDETIHRLQDWALWLEMLRQGRYGTFCGKLIFTTAVRNGITHGGPVDYESAHRMVSAKYGL